MSSDALPRRAGAEDLKDLGFGSRVSEESRARLLNRDGTFNVRRRGLSVGRSLSVYHACLTMTWPRFYAVIVASYVVLNVLFAFAYLACGPEALASESAPRSFETAFFFSVQTLATIGYGQITPRGLAANLLVTLEALVGLLAFSIATGLTFARISRPSARIVFSDRAVIAPYRGITAFEFRIANERTNQIQDVTARVLFSRMKSVEGRRVRKYDALELERQSVVFLPLHWTIVHPITPDSPLHGATPESLRADEAEFLILLTAADETFSQSVHARSSYRADEVRFGARFGDMFQTTANGVVSIDLRRLHEIEPA